jgi:predicted ArsR family transcriptional regulator
MKKAGSRSEILGMLRERDCTVRDLAAALGLTRNAIRAQLEILDSEGLVRRSGHQSGFRKPHVVYTLTEKAAHAFPNAYGLLLEQMLEVLLHRLSPGEAKVWLRELGRRLATEPARQAAGKDSNARRRLALKVLASIGGEPFLYKKNGSELIEGKACPLAVITSKHPEACLIATTLVSEILGQPVQEQCFHGPRPRCRFQISDSDDAGESGAGKQNIQK